MSKGEGPRGGRGGGAEGIVVGGPERERVWAHRAVERERESGT